MCLLAASLRNGSDSGRPVITNNGTSGGDAAATSRPVPVPPISKSVTIRLSPSTAINCAASSTEAASMTSCPCFAQVSPNSAAHGIIVINQQNQSVFMKRRYDVGNAKRNMRPCFWPIARAAINRNRCPIGPRALKVVRFELAGEGDLVVNEGVNVIYKPVFALLGDVLQGVPKICAGLHQGIGNLEHRLERAIGMDQFQVMIMNGNRLRNQVQP
ncbi:hypothetical protein GQR58_030071 [Nymphon striatum]|nr:hypothetical protein GQR58_030071 [Nymphon striatum]